MSEITDGPSPTPAWDKCLEGVAPALVRWGPGLATCLVNQSQRACLDPCRVSARRRPAPWGLAGLPCLRHLHLCPSFLRKSWKPPSRPQTGS